MRWFVGLFRHMSEGDMAFEIFWSGSTTCREISNFASVRSALRDTKRRAVRYYAPKCSEVGVAKHFISGA